MKTIERYDIERDEWVELKIHLNYPRNYASAIAIKERYIYVIGGTSSTDCIEIIDSYKEEQLCKAELVLLQLNQYIPWFKEMILPVNDEEALMIFCRN